jgi:hypothetical protein
MNIGSLRQYLTALRKEHFHWEKQQESTLLFYARIHLRFNSKMLRLRFTNVRFETV